MRFHLKTFFVNEFLTAVLKSEWQDLKPNGIVVELMFFELLIFFPKQTEADLISSRTNPTISYEECRYEKEACANFWAITVNSIQRRL